MSYFKRHLFFCTNERAPGADRPSCNLCDATRMRAYAKKLSKKIGIAGEGGVRVNTAGCMDRCEEGPVCVVYPDGVWYTYVDEEDIREIVESHLGRGQVVERLKI